MAFIVIPFGSGTPRDAFSFPNAVSICVSDDGGGGQVFINGLGITSGTLAGAVDLKTYFGSSFRSTPLLRAFRALVGVTGGNQNQLTEQQLCNNLRISFIPIVATTAFPNIAYLAGTGGAPVTTPLLSFQGPGVSGQWRIEIEFRHSITN
jgi:hypothetical protein